jgi:hypothetical protein
VIIPSSSHFSTSSEMNFLTAPDGLTSEALENWRREFPEVFSGRLSSVPAKVEGMEIALKEGASLPVSKPPRHHSGAVRKFISEEVAKWLEDGIITPSNASYASQVVVVKARTKPDLFPLPSVKPLLRRVAGKAYYAKFDLKKGYLQLSVKEEYRHLTAFICELGVFQFNRVPL